MIYQEDKMQYQIGVTYLTSDKEKFIDHAARRRMGFDWHRGVGVFNQPWCTREQEGEVEKNEGFRTYSIVDHGTVDGTPVRNEVQLSPDSSSYFNNSAAENAYSLFGNSHWNNYGKNEARALPGSKFSIDGGKNNI